MVSTDRYHIGLILGGLAQSVASVTGIFYSLLSMESQPQNAELGRF